MHCPLNERRVFAGQIFSRAEIAGKWVYLSQWLFPETQTKTKGMFLFYEGKYLDYVNIYNQCEVSQSLHTQEIH